MLVLDEADRMLDMGFIDDVRRIIRHVPDERQTMLFSATIPEEIKQLAASIMKGPEVISTSSDELTVDEVEQCYYEVPQERKLDSFVRVVGLERPRSAIVFCNTKRWADTLIRLMKRRGLHGEALHGDLSQGQRDRVMDGFRKGRFRFLVATDVAARGLDIDDVSHIFNYDLPRERGNYVHRIGRTARAGNSGKAISFITPCETRDLWDIEHYCRTKIKEAKLE
jgi:ATP-dependent RNA helicase DeaD